MAHWSDVSTPETVPAQPWLHPAAIDYLDHLLQPEWDVLEHGSGGSTLWIASRVKSVTSVEDKPEWRDAILARSPGNVNIILHPGKGVPDNLGGPYDLLFIDGEPTSNRAAWLKRTDQLVKPGGWVVLDNCNNHKYIAERDIMRKLFDHVTFTSTVGFYLNTEFYRIIHKNGGENA